MTQNDTIGAIELSHYVDGWAPDPVEAVDVVRPERLAHIARTLGFDEARFADGTVPILGHRTAFHDWPATTELGADGHPETRHFFPPIPNRRRMFAGSTVTPKST